MLEKFADMELQYLGETIWLPETKLGDYIGSGNGTITGDDLAGDVKWSLFENQAPDVCDFTLLGTINDAEGTEHGFEILGYSAHEPDTRTWRLSAGIRFASRMSGEKFPATGVVTGVFESESQTHRYELFRNAG
ncbi:MAG: hypothetical protein HOK98_14030 [Rhodospirillaceae bacterium]|jgi:hypothetical protein|nr:hypothetical protein [Rhodospirillaceae bacterium]MBT5944860.1 hypothetical protein [Rhodospirillaceae bacterium]MBT6405458.1 hypothetical protein [Rhodospirillaceae bacterium]MBT6537289.1 hypothetical protein [Rhodospirillaceae bacterium]MBT7362645.1 hypothetical protein [Rhodospirillaceae bacterium]